MSIQSILTEAREWRRLRIDPAWVAVAAIFAVLAVLVPHQATVSAGFTAKAVWSVLPFLVLSIGSRRLRQGDRCGEPIAKAFSGRSEVMIVFASLMGALSPFCSCGVIPVIAALLASGVPLAPVMAFWLASPLMDPSMFAITTGVLGLPFAVARPLLPSLSACWAASACSPCSASASSLDRRCGTASEMAAAQARRFAISKAVVWRYWQEPARRETFRAGARQNFSLFLGKWLVLAFVLESLMVAYVPADLIANVAGDGGFLSILGATLVGIPAISTAMPRSLWSLD